MKQDIEVDLDSSRHRNPLKKTLQSLRRSVGTFLLTDIQEAVDMNAKFWAIVRRVLHEHSYRYQYAEKRVSWPLKTFPNVNEICSKVQCITTKLLDREDILLILMRLVRSTRQIHNNKQGHQGLVCGERKGKSCIRNAVPRARKKGL